MKKCLTEYKYKSEDIVLIAGDFNVDANDSPFDVSKME